VRGYLGCDIPGEPDYNPYSTTTCLLSVEADTDRGWIADANRMMCDLVGWERGNFGDPKDPECRTQTLIGKPLDVLVPPIFRRSHHLLRRAFVAHPSPRTMGEGRNTPIWVKDPGVEVNGMRSIRGTQLTVLIGLSPIDDVYTLAIVQPMEIVRKFIQPGARPAR
jgi:hypothetical protein